MKRADGDGFFGYLILFGCMFFFGWSQMEKQGKTGVIFAGPYIRIPDPSVPLCSLLIFARNGETRDIVVICPWGSGPRGFFPLALVIHCFY